MKCINIRKKKNLNNLLIMFLILSILNLTIFVGAGECEIISTGSVAIDPDGTIELIREYNQFPPGTVIHGEISKKPKEVISIGSAAVGPGEIIVIPVTIAKATKVEGVRLDLIYNPEVVSILNITANESIPSSVIIVNTDDPGNVSIVLINPEYITVTSETSLIDITFKAATNGTSALELINVELTKDFIPYSARTVNNGEITITAVLYTTIDPVTSPTNINYQTITGTMESGATVVVTCLTASVGIVTSPDATTWSVEIIYMSDGENVIIATATDQMGNIKSANETVLLDTVQPFLIL